MPWISNLQAASTIYVSFLYILSFCCKTVSSAHVMEHVILDRGEFSENQMPSLVKGKMYAYYKNAKETVYLDLKAYTNT